MWDGSLARLELCGLTKRYAGASFPALEQFDLSVEACEFLTLVGPSGSGKTTLLRLIAGLDAPTQGSVWIGNRSMTGVAPSRRGVALVFQQPALYPHLNVFENIAFGLRARGIRRTELRNQVSEMADLVRIEPLLSRSPAELSGGEQQRVALARALAIKPAVLLLDEPFAGLDTPLRLALRELLLDLQRRLGMTTLMVTHDQAEALALGDRVAVLEAGRLLQCDTPRDVYNQPASRFVATFLGSPTINILPLDIERTVGAFRLRRHEMVLQVPSDTRWAAPLHAVAGGRVELAVRPQHVSLATDRPASSSFLPLQGRAVRQELRGHEMLTSVDCQGAMLHLLMPPDRVVEPNSEIAVRLDLSRAVWFDPATGLRLEAPDAAARDPFDSRHDPLPFRNASSALVG